MSEEGHKFPLAITSAGLKEHYRLLNVDVRFAAKEFKKIDVRTSLSLYALADVIEEGSIDELFPYIEAFIADRQVQIQEGDWPYGGIKGNYLGDSKE